MKNFLFLLLLCIAYTACKTDKKSPADIDELSSDSISAEIDSISEILAEPKEKSVRELKEELAAKGFKIFDYIDEKTKDTILMQQYFMAFLKTGPIRGQNEEETADLQNEHLAHLGKMYELGYADISGPFGDNGDIRGVTIYNVPTLKMADSLANADPMVKAGRLKIEIHPWWAAKGYPLR